MKCVANCTMLLKSNIIHINTVKIGFKKIAISVSIDRNGCAVFIFNEIWANEASVQQVINSHS